MANTKTIPSQSASPVVAREWTASDLGLTGVNLNTTGVVSGNIIDVCGLRHFHACLEYVIVGTAPATGTVAMRIEAFDLNDAALLDAVIILSLSSTEAAGTYRTGVSWGSGTTAKVGTGTITAANFDVLKALKRVRLSLNRSVAHNAGTSMTANVRLVGSQ